jgi:signal transduction histidine kinase
VLVHDPAALDDPQLVEGITAATKLAVANARLQADVRARLDEVERSRRRLLDAEDAQRRALALELRHGAEERLAHVAERLTDGDPALEELRVAVNTARSSLSELARGIHPAILTDAGLTAAIDELAARAPLEVEVHAPTDRLPSALEIAAYFVCSEALTNLIKHARASTASIRITCTETVLIVEVTDNGIGGADPARGSGLSGLADRVETLGGALTIGSAPEHGTRLTAELPLARD